MHVESTTAFHDRFQSTPPFQGVVTDGAAPKGSRKRWIVRATYGASASSGKQTGRRSKSQRSKSWLEVACRRAGLPPSRNLHRLRDTFCSHLAMGGVPMKAIQVWAGHANLKTTQRYMHLSPEGMDGMISVLERGAGVEQQSTRARNERASPQRFELYRAR